MTGQLPRIRSLQTESFFVADADGYMTASSYPDDGLGEVFLKLGKQGPTLDGVMDAFSVALHHACVGDVCRDVHQHAPYAF